MAAVGARNNGVLRLDTQSRRRRAGRRREKAGAGRLTGRLFVGGEGPAIFVVTRLF